ncbi:MAG TPA: XdhC family protein [Methyloceanibacter sp.]|nr:XdhC family protein [Methyloceanibacter sp.]
MSVLNLQRELKPQNGPIDVARRWLDEFGQVTLATVVSTWGSSPVPVGGQLVVAPGGRFEGSVSGGCVEADVISEAADVMVTGHSKLLEFGVADETAWRSGLPCGGTMKVFLERLERIPDVAYLDALLAARRSRTSLAVVTNLITAARRIFDSASTMPSELAEDLVAGESRLIEMTEGEVFLHVLAPPVRVVIAGATQIGQVLSDLAKRIGYDVVIVDPRSAFATPERFAATPILTDWPGDSFRAIGLDARSAVIALTHAAHLDDEALGEAMRSNCLYIGALGSKKTQAKRLERLRAADFTDDQLARIHAPVGLAIGAKGPAEIALAILAEIVKVARGVP